MVWNTLRLMLTRGLSIIRWNNFPRVVDIKHMDNVGMTLHTALFLAHQSKPFLNTLSKSPHPNPLLKEREQAAVSSSPLGEELRWGKSSEVDTLYLMKKIIFTSFADLILSDINSGTRNYIKDLDEAIFSELYGKAYEYFLNGKGEELLQNDFRDSLNRSDREIEDQIFLAAKKYVGHFESQMNARVFPEIYAVPLQKIQQELQDLSKSLPSLQELLQDKNLESYLAHVYRLSFSMRWNQYNRRTPISVMSHKVIVAYLSYIIGMIGNQNGEANDIEEMMLRAIYHDVPEVITGDIITPTKRAVPGFIELLEKVEKTMLDDYLFDYISPEYKDFIAPYMLEPFDDELGKKVKYADILSAFLEAKIEKNHNYLFAEKYQYLLSQIEKIDNIGLDFIIKEVFYHFDSTQDDAISK
jgi:putative hydrolase of HD superfamily